MRRSERSTPASEPVEGCYEIPSAKADVDLGVVVVLARTGWWEQAWSELAARGGERLGSASLMPVARAWADAGASRDAVFFGAKLLGLDAGGWRKSLTGSGLLGKALERRAVGSAKLLIEAGADIEELDHQRLTPLLSCAKYRRSEALAMLVANGANVDAVDDEGYTALMLASLGGEVESVRLLIEAGANPNATGRFAVTAIILASNIDRISGGFGTIESRNAGSRIVEALIGAGADVNAVNDEGETALLKAASRGAESTARALVLGGADLTFKTPGGELDALGVALAYENDVCALALLELGADPFVEYFDASGTKVSALELAEAYGLKKSLAVLAAAHERKALDEATCGIEPRSEAPRL